jgi:alkylated DNA repair dioxygenase AlkB
MRFTIVDLNFVTSSTKEKKNRSEALIINYYDGGDA